MRGAAALGARRPTCDSIDVIAENLMLPELKAGDLIVGRAMGAYTWASASDFNFFPKATVVAVNETPGDTGKRPTFLPAVALCLALLFGGRAHAGDWIDLHNTHTGETAKVAFRDEHGAFIPAALEKLNAILGDHRSHQQTSMDPQLFVLLVDLAASAGVEPHYEIISGYR